MLVDADGRRASVHVHPRVHHAIHVPSRVWLNNCSKFAKTSNIVRNTNLNKGAFHYIVSYQVVGQSTAGKAH
jgi:hypothetical protein